jgi:hypothetical protein
MPKAETPDTTSAPYVPWAATEIQEQLRILDGAIGVAHHLAARGDEVTVGDDEWQVVLEAAQKASDAIAKSWDRARLEEGARAIADEEALTAEKARKAVPGSPADLERAEGLWDLLRGVPALLAERLNERFADRDAEMIRLCNRLVEISAAENKMTMEIEDDAERDIQGKSLADEWRAIQERLLELGKPTTLAGARTMARAAPPWVNLNEDGSPMSGELGMHLLLGAAAFLSDDSAPYWTGTATRPVPPTRAAPEGGLFYVRITRLRPAISSDRTK